MIGLVKSLGFKYVGNWKCIIGGCSPDFIHTKLPLVIEFFGEYWHGKSDISRKRYHYYKHGYKTLIVWQKQLNSDPERVVSRVKAFISKSA
jgi:very-short-patch-repair endonuclease